MTLSINARTPAAPNCISCINTLQRGKEPAYLQPRPLHRPSKFRSRRRSILPINEIGEIDGYVDLSGVRPILTIVPALYFQDRKNEDSDPVDVEVTREVPFGD